MRSSSCEPQAGCCGAHQEPVRGAFHQLSPDGPFDGRLRGTGKAGGGLSDLEGCAEGEHASEGTAVAVELLPEGFVP